MKTNNDLKSRISLGETMKFFFGLILAVTLLCTQQSNAALKQSIVISVWQETLYLQASCEKIRFHANPKLKNELGPLLIASADGEICTLITDVAHGTWFAEKVEQVILDENNRIIGVGLSSNQGMKLYQEQDASH